MKAAVLTEFRKPLEVRELPDPRPGETDAVVKLDACGICRSDWHLWQEDFTWVGIILPLPCVPGHECGGRVVDVGSKVSKFAVGDPVTIPFHLACGQCEFCSTGRSNICQALGFIGAHVGGGFGEYACVPNADTNLVRLPDGVAPASAASLGCRFMTAYHGLIDRARVRPGEWVAVFGIGGLGLATVQIASALGARVVAVGRTPEKLEKAKREGAVATVQAGEGASAAIREITGGGADIAVDALGQSGTAVPAVLSLRKGGRHLRLGLTGQEDKGIIGLPVDAMMFQELSFLCSLGCPTTSYPGMLSMVASGALKPDRLTEGTVGLDGVNGILERMTEFRTNGFNVITSWS